MSTRIDPAQTTSPVGYWDRYGTGQADAETPEEALKNAFGWCQYEGHGPGDELLGQPATALELGFGRGNAVAALASKGIDATGVDVSSVQRERAAARWGHLANAEFVRSEVVDFLSGAGGRRWEAVYSIWGAVWFTDPERLLPLILDRLEPGGRLVFSHAPAVPGAYGPQGMYGAGFTGRPVWLYRWAYEPEQWADLLARYGFTDVDVRIHPAPAPELLGTLIATACRAR
ncbi:class I SAM-dependent methyltransferase [Nocardiopsis halophila]|uniref:class I SAM-dependent methyltransferase n=1 Tax=Nocardiopsis halophila TaxID=141692 RepID=UPI00034535FF|nr:class I SAM-dependent methyltransferase [Nocardiopsis halophila]